MRIEGELTPSGTNPRWRASLVWTAVFSTLCNIVIALFAAAAWATSYFLLGLSEIFWPGLADKPSATWFAGVTAAAVLVNLGLSFALAVAMARVESFDPWPTWLIALTSSLIGLSFVAVTFWLWAS